MYTVTINNEINLTYPDGFAQMSEEALTRYFSTPNNRWGVYNDERHIILSVSWTKTGIGRPSNPDDLLTQVQARMCRNLLCYQKLGEFKIKIGGKKSSGIRFMYRVNDAKVVHIADLFVFKHKKHLYAVHYITRKATAAEDRLLLQEALNSITVQ